MDKLKALNLENVDITDGFWARRQKQNREVTVYAVQEQFENSGRFRAFDFSWKKGEPQQPHFFWDSDIAKWMESAALICEKNPEPELREKIDKTLALIEKNQAPDGYFNIYHTVVEPGTRFTNRDHHELYCLGHLIEAAVAYYNAFASDRFIKVVDRYIDCVIKAFVTQKTAAFITPGHEEIELALLKLYELRREKKYLELAMFFLNERGVNKEENYVNGNDSYAQNHLPVRCQKEASGHAVRACYLYTGMAMAAGVTADEELLCACRSLFCDITEKKMYVSGGIGSTHLGEAFTIAYDLPNDTAYAETCASIALYMFANAMKDIDIDSKYADIAELEMYNGIISGISLDGKAFFYENPLEINLADAVRHSSVKMTERLPITQRKEVFGCSCCPPNLTRFTASVGSSALSVTEGGDIFIHQFMTLNAMAAGAEISMETEYPASGRVNISVSGGGRKIYVRIPGWCEKYSISCDYTVFHGYACIDFKGGIFSFELDFEMRPVLLTASSHVRADAGKAALKFGPVLYCLEAVDNQAELFGLEIDSKSEFTAEFDEYFGAAVIKAKAFRRSDSSEKPYKPINEIAKEKTDIKFIPYYAFANRGASDMAVWFRIVQENVK